MPRNASPATDYGHITIRLKANQYRYGNGFERSLGLLERSEGCFRRETHVHQEGSYPAMSPKAPKNLLDAKSPSPERSTLKLVLAREGPLLGAMALETHPS